MKKFSMFIVCLIITFLLSTGSVFAFTDEFSVPLTVTVFDADFVSITNTGPTSISVVVIKQQTNYLVKGSDKLSVQNNGTMPVDFQLKAEETVGSDLSIFTNSSADPGTDEVKLFGVFTHFETNFNATRLDDGNDTIPTVYGRTATDDIFGDTDDPIETHGHNFLDGELVLRIAIFPGDISTSGSKLLADIYMKAIASP